MIILLYKQVLSNLSNLSNFLSSLSNLIIFSQQSQQLQQFSQQSQISDLQKILFIILLSRVDSTCHAQLSIKHWKEKNKWTRTQLHVTVYFSTSLYVCVCMWVCGWMILSILLNDRPTLIEHRTHKPTTEKATNKPIFFRVPLDPIQPHPTMHQHQLNLLMNIKTLEDNRKANDHQPKVITLQIPVHFFE